MSFMASKKMLLVGGGVTDADARALIARMSPKPSPIQTRAIDRLVKDLKAAGIWPKLSNFYMLAAHSLQAALLNWKGATGTLDTEGGVPFTAGKGVRGSLAGRISFNISANQPRNLTFGAWAGQLEPPQGSDRAMMFGRFYRGGVEDSRSTLYMAGPYYNSSGGVSQGGIIVGNEPADYPALNPIPAELCIGVSEISSDMKASMNGASGQSRTNWDGFIYTGKIPVNHQIYDNGQNDGNGTYMFRSSWFGLQGLSDGQTSSLYISLQRYLKAVGAIA